MDNEDYTQFASFAAINDFMLADFRFQIIQHVFSNIKRLPDAHRKQIDSLTRHLVVVPGFRNSTMAPILLKTRNAVQAFEKSPEFVRLILQGWAFLLPDLGSQVHAMLTDLDWDVLPVDADRSKMPGFFPSWPDQHNFVSLNERFSSQYPDTKYTSDEISLMVVWLSLCLPYNQDIPDDDST